MMWRADSRTNKVALSSRPKPVTVVRSKAAQFRRSRTYVGTLQPWLEANIGPQLVSAYVDTVLVRPGAVVKQREVLATLDCRDASASAKAVAAAARAIDAHQKAVAHEAVRTAGLLGGGFVSPNELEKRTAQSATEEAEFEAERAKLARTSLEVNDCVLRAPFNGEISRRYVDPGAYVRPGTSILTLVDRNTVRMTADAPEIDFDLIPPGSKVVVHVFATKRDFPAIITRRTPAASQATRTVHFEVDIPDPSRSIPVGTTGEVRIDVGTPIPATEVPLYAATVRGSKASLFAIENGVAHARTLVVTGEFGGSLFVETALAPDSMVVTEGRTLLEEGDHVQAQVEADTSLGASTSTPAPVLSPRERPANPNKTL